MKLYFFLEPLRLKLGNEYNFNNVKEIKVTEEFLTLDKNVRNCQNYESLQDCKTRICIDSIVKKCKCLPFSIRSSEVHCQSNHIVSFLYFTF